MLFTLCAPWSQYVPLIKIIKASGTTEMPRCGNHSINITMSTEG
jgi:hypothetical protein